MAIVNADVQAIIDTARDTSPFIETAQLIVDEELDGSGLSDERLDRIVLYLAAHFVCLTEEAGGLRRSKLGESDESFRVPGDKDVGLAFTRYGQQAMLLDTTGRLASINAKNGLKALIEVI
jgi:hypothetical protein